LYGGGEADFIPAPEPAAEVAGSGVQTNPQSGMVTNQSAYSNLDVPGQSLGSASPVRAGDAEAALGTFGTPPAPARPLDASAARAVVQRGSSGMVAEGFSNRPRLVGPSTPSAVRNEA